MADLVIDLMRANAAPAEQFQRLGLPVHGDVSDEHLVIEADRERVAAAFTPMPDRATLRRISADIDTPIGELMSRPDTRAEIAR